MFGRGREALSVGRQGSKGRAGLEDPPGEPAGPPSVTAGVGRPSRKTQRGGSSTQKTQRGQEQS